MTYRHVLLLLLLSLSGYAEEEKPICVLHSRYAGMFSIFGDVLTLCDAYERGLFSGIQVTFDGGGLFHHTEYGPNWWHYYCEPICLGNHSESFIRLDMKLVESFLQDVTRQRAHELITNYIHILPSIQKEVEDFVDTHFNNHFILSVHYRGSDKRREAPRVSYAVVIDAIQQFIQERPLETIKIFLATDEEPFCELMQNTFSAEQLCVNPCTVRTDSKAPLGTHYSGHRYENGKNALIDCLLLSRGDYLIRTSSNLSRWATFFNPDIPVLELSRSYCEL